MTDVAALLPEAARSALLKDPHTQATFELLLNWMYMLTSRFTLPSFSEGQPAAPSAAPSAAAPKAVNISDDSERPSPSFQVGLVGHGLLFDGHLRHAEQSWRRRRLICAPTPLASSRGSSKDLTKAGGGGSRTAAVKPEQIPLLWQLADALGVCGLKALAPLFEQSALPSTFVMEAPAFERLKLLVRALELHTEEIVGALCEQLAATASAHRRRQGPAAASRGDGRACGRGECRRPRPL